MISTPPTKKRKKETSPKLPVDTPLSNDYKELLCPICKEIIKEAYITQCGHSYCYFCILESCKISNKCPQCSTVISQDKLIPNFQLNTVLSHYRKSEYHFVDRKHSVRQLTDFVKEKNYNADEIADLLDELVDLKEKKKKEEEEIETEVFLEFLRKTKEEKQNTLLAIQLHLKFLDDDISRLSSFHPHSLDIHNNINNINNNNMNNNNNNTNNHITDNEDRMEDGTPDSPFNQTRSDNFHNDNNNNNNNNNNNKSKKEEKEKKSINTKKRKLMECLPNLQNLYFQVKERQPAADLSTFAKSLAKFTMYSSCKKLTTVRLAEPFSPSTIVSSLEFDRDEEFFATAGVNKILRVYEYKTISHSPALSFPRHEMPCRSKISSLCWNPYLKPYIASTDYEGRVSIWDADEGRKIISLEEHTKRAWSVDFSHTIPTLLASGSDDMTVKIWCMNQRKSTLTIQGTANVCSVAFNPYLSNEIALGLADHDIKYYDLRHLSQPLRTFAGHRKSVSYVKFLSKTELVSASTDSTLKLWNLTDDDDNCTRTFMGHINEKNFVGLSCSNDYIACGSENNSMYIYYKEISHPAVVHRFSQVEDPNKYFISSICWRKRDNILLSANSEGAIKIFSVE